MFDPGSIAARLSCADRIERARALQELFCHSFLPQHRAAIVEEVGFAFLKLLNRTHRCVISAKVINTAFGTY